MSSKHSKRICSLEVVMDYMPQSVAIGFVVCILHTIARKKTGKYMTSRYELLSPYIAGHVMFDVDLFDDVPDLFWRLNNA